MQCDLDAMDVQVNVNQLRMMPLGFDQTVENSNLEDLVDYIGTGSEVNLSTDL